MKNVLVVSTLVFFFPISAEAASFDGSIQSVVTGVIKIFQIIAIGYLAKNAFDHVRNRPDAAEKTPGVVFGVVSLLAINAVWAWLQDKIH